jgi:hypothetical protein
MNHEGIFFFGYMELFCGKLLYNLRRYRKTEYIDKYAYKENVIIIKFS